MYQATVKDVRTTLSPEAQIALSRTQGATRDLDAYIAAPTNMVYALDILPAAMQYLDARRADGSLDVTPLAQNALSVCSDMPTLM